MNLDAVIVGLGNPGPRYSFTRHNAGFIALDMLAQDLGLKFKTDKSLNAETCEGTWGSKKVLLIKPQTFMNLSGESINSLYAKFNHLREQPLIVFHDEADLPLGRIRVKMGGSDAGHNGLKNIRELLGHGEFFRVRLGVSAPDSEGDRRDMVLENFSKKEEDTLIQMLDQGLKATLALLEKDLAASQAIASKDLLSQKPD